MVPVQRTGQKISNRPIQFARPLADKFEPDQRNEANILAAVLELGKALQGAGQESKSRATFELITGQIGPLAAEAGFLLGEMQFAAKEHGEAIDTFKLVVYGHGGTRSVDDVKPWQAKSAYEIARCNHVQIASAGSARQAELKAEAVKWYQYVVDNYQDLNDDRLVQKLVQTARGELTKLQ